jgi:hypothetical protein
MHAACTVITSASYGAFSTPPYIHNNTNNRLLFELKNPNWTSSVRGRRADGMTAVFVAAVLAMGFTSFLLVAPLQPAHAEAIGSWVKTTSYPSKTQDLSCVTSDDYIYCVGGVVSPSGAHENSVYYAPLSSSGIGAWTQTTSYPIAVYSLSCVTSESYIYCIGGSNDSAPVTNVYFAPLSSSGVGAWQSTAAYPTPIDGESCVVTLQSYVYCVGGNLSFSTGGSANVYYAPLSSSGVGTWMGATSYPVPVWFESCVYVPGQTGGFIHCMGDESMQVPSNSVYSAPISASGGLLGAWSLTGTMPAGDFGESCVLGAATVTTGYLHCIGGFPGFRAFPTSSVFYAPVSPMTGAMGSWVDTAPYPVNEAYQSCVASSPYIYCVGGYTSDSYYTSSSTSMTGTSQVTVNTIDTIGRTLVGYYTVLYQGGKMVDSGFSPITFTVNNNEQYTIQMDNYSVCNFGTWQDTGRSGQKTFSVSGDAQFTAIYDCTTVVSNINIVTDNSTNAQIDGLYTTLSSQQTGRVLQACFSPCFFQVTNGQNYTVTLANFGSETLTSWGDGEGNVYSWGGSYTFAIPSGPGVFSTFMSARYTP